MTAIDRRLLLKGATLGLAALALPAWAQVMNARGFTHNVASGEPGATRVMLWTRYVPASGDTGRLTWQVARDHDFTAIVARGAIEASPEHDFCVKPFAQGLTPGKWYFYRFTDERGTMSPVGRTRTLPHGRLKHFTLALFSCSNLPFGWFNAYGHAAARSDIDLMVHVGDYFYEYERGTYPSFDEAVPGRVIEPPTEAMTLADYRMRFASYRLDPDLQKLHQYFPTVTVWDDHESANDSWKDGAENHQPETEGPWGPRKEASMQAYREWMPVSDEPWTSYRIGDLAELFRVETRLTARSEQLHLSKYLASRSDVAQSVALADFHDKLWLAPERTLMGAEQERWLASAFRASTRDRVRWQVLAQQVVMGSLFMTPQVAALVPGDPQFATALAAARAHIPVNMDSWDGYPAARARLLKASLAADANLVVLSGDSHNAWAFDLAVGGNRAGIEVGGQSVTSPGYESEVKADPAQLAAAIMAGNRPLKWADTSRRGYVTVSLDHHRAIAEWNFVKTIRDRSTALSGTHRMVADWGALRYDKV